MCIVQVVPGSEQFDRVAMKIKLSCGFAILDQAIDGLPREECLIYFLGKGHHDKSTVLDNMIIGLLEDNKDVIIFLHTVDAPLSGRIPRLKGAKYLWPSKYFKKAGYFLKNPAALPPPYREFEKINAEASAWINSMVNQERLILADVDGLPPQLPAVEQWVRAIRNKFPKKALVVMLDNFHSYDLPDCDPADSKIRNKLIFVNRLSAQYRCLIVVSVSSKRSTKMHAAAQRNCWNTKERHD